MLKIYDLKITEVETFQHYFPKERCWKFTINFDLRSVDKSNEIPEFGVCILQNVPPTLLLPHCKVKATEFQTL